MRVFGNIYSRMSESVNKVPEVGMGATINMYTDRHAATIVEVKSPTKIVIQQDSAERTDSNGMSESQDYAFTPNPKAAKEVYTKRKNGLWIKTGESKGNGTSLHIGQRNEYHDYSF
jgi:hypothetical protein